MPTLFAARHLWVSAGFDPVDGGGKGLQVDADAFQREMEKQRQRSAAARETVYATIEVDAALDGSEFVGYVSDEVATQVVLADKERIILRETPFYAESGGQIGDRGWIENEQMKFQVEDTKQIGEHIVHFGRLQSGRLPAVGAGVTARIDSARACDRTQPHRDASVAPRAGAKFWVSTCIRRDRWCTRTICALILPILKRSANLICGASKGSSMNAFWKIVG